MKKLIPLILGIITVIIFSVSALQRESDLKNGTVMFVELGPADPRSLIQGDYMILDYQLYFNDNESIANLEERNKRRLVVELNQDSRLITSYEFTGQTLKTNQHLLWVKRNNSWSWWGMYPATNSFLFGEGLAHCYQVAKYAELRVTPEGNAMLYKLTDENLVRLTCTSKDIDPDEKL